jgi:cell division protein FtsQ
MTRHPASRRALLVAVLVLAAVGGWLWVRDSSLLAVREVRVIGLSGPQSRDVRSALTEAAREMTTLRVREDALRAAAEPYPIVREVHADADLPNTLRVEVDAHVPVAALEAGGERTAVAADGTLLTHTPTRGLPAIQVRVRPAVARVTSGPAARLLALLAAAPGPLRGRAERAFAGPRGLTVDLRDGPRVVFGEAGRPVAAWLSAARVLADPSTEGASYVDVRVPGRPAVGGLPPLGQLGEEDAEETDDVEHQAQLEGQISP